MNDLPQQGNSSDSQQPKTVPIAVGSGLGKEGEAAPSSELSIQDIQKELEIPKEVVSSGVKVQPTVVSLPKSVSQMGVKPTGLNTGVGTGSTISLPLTQPQITQGLKQSILDSWRWLAVWCIRRLKQLRFFQIKK